MSDSYHTCLQCSHKFSDYQDLQTHIKSHNDIMSGRLWYERFTNGYRPLNRFVSKEYNDGYADSYIKAIESAKKASGLN